MTPDNSRGSTYVSSSLPVVHGDGEHYQVRLGAIGFYVTDDDERIDDGKRVLAVTGAMPQKFRARSRCDKLNADERDGHA